MLCLPCVDVAYANVRDPYGCVCCVLGSNTAGVLLGQLRQLAVNTETLKFQGDTREHICSHACLAVLAVHLISRHKNVKNYQWLITVY